MSKSINHLKTIFLHKHYVCKFCFMCGLYRQGIMHDLSKLSVTEFSENRKYYTNGKSPIDVCRKENGYSTAWLHHKGRNKHHWEYWIEIRNSQIIPVKMPFKYALEMVCDFLGAGKAYNKDNFSIDKEYDWWQLKRGTAYVHEDTKRLVDYLFAHMKYHGIKETLSNKILISSLRDTYAVSPSSLCFISNPAQP